MWKWCNKQTNKQTKKVAKHDFDGPIITQNHNRQIELSLNVSNYNAEIFYLNNK